MPGAARVMTACTVGGLILATAYSVALGSSGWLWLAWLVLAGVTIGVVSAKGW